MVDEQRKGSAVKLKVARDINESPENPDLNFL